MSMRITISTSICLLVCSILAVLQAQNRSTAEIAGTVTDPSGAVLPGVNDTVTNTATGITTRVATNRAGAGAIGVACAPRCVIEGARR
jgi:hypothetical protein